MKKEILLAMLSFSLLLAACGEDDIPEPEPTLLPPSAYSSQRDPLPDSDIPETGTEPSGLHSGNAPTYAEGKELFAHADSLEDAKEIADLYGIELVDYQYGYATFHTEERVADVIKRGGTNGWPTLEINHTGGVAG